MTSTPDLRADEEAITDVVHAFFAAFVSGPDTATRMDELRALFVPGAVIVRTCGSAPVVYDVEGFIAPRQTLLASGDLTDFREWELSGRTDIFGDIAQHWCTYAKSWSQDGAHTTARGMKTLQLVRTTAGWRISAAAWDDERDGLTVPVDR